MSDFSIEHLLKTIDHHPQLVGKLDLIPPGTVTIEVWRCSASGVQAVSLATDECYAIGDTGRWGWSTAGLDTTGANDRRSYFYRMTGSNGITFEGAFFVNDLTGMPGSRKRARRRER